MMLLMIYIIDVIDVGDCAVVDHVNDVDVDYVDVVMMF